MSSSLKGYYPVEIPTKKYIKAYILAQLGEQPIMNTENNIGNKLYDVLTHRTNERKKQFASKRYDCTIRLYVSYHTFRQRGAFLNESNITAFNIYIEQEIKFRMRHYLDFYIDMLPSFSAHLPDVRRRLGIDIEAWSDDSMQKDYWRYRKRNKLKAFYDKKSDRAVPRERADDVPF